MGARMLVPVSEWNENNPVTDHCWIGVNLYTSTAVSDFWKGQLASGSLSKRNTSKAACL